MQIGNKNPVGSVEVKVGVGVEVSVLAGSVFVGVDVEVELLVGLKVGVSGSGVKIGSEVTDERTTGVDVPGTGGVGKRVEMSASRMRMPMPMGMAYCRSVASRGLGLSASTGGFPVYPNALNRLLRLSTYSPEAKLM